MARVFASNWVGRGPVTDQFEQEFAAHLACPRPLVRSVSCCTEGLFQAVALLGIGAGDEVVLPSISFIGAAHAIAASGATPVFCDVDPATLNATAATIDARLSPRTRAILLLHYGGLPCDLDPILALAARRRIAIVEDSACSVASTHRGQACGTFGEVGVWSFDAMKILVTGDGGMVYCRTPEMALRLERELYLGLTSASGFSNPHESRWWELDATGIGRRAIMNDVASAIGVVQLRRLPAFIARRRAVHHLYDATLADLSWLAAPPPVPAHAASSYYLYWIRLARGEYRDRLASWLRERGIYTSFRYYPVHRVPMYAGGPALPNADQAAETTLCLPLHQGLSDDDAGRVAEAIRDFGRTI